MMFEKEVSRGNVNPTSLLDEDFCYSIDKNSKRRRSESKDMRSA